MSDTLDQIIALVSRSEVRVSDHGYDELLADGIFVRDLVESIVGAKVVEDYPNYWKSPCVLVLQRCRDNSAVHAVWGILKGQTTPAVLVTAYRPDPAKWTDDFMRRIE